jgi:hypothetical protein
MVNSQVVARRRSASEGGETNCGPQPGRAAARRSLADHREFVLDDAARCRWELINRRPGGPLAGLRALMARPAPFDV